MVNPFRTSRLVLVMTDCQPYLCEHPILKSARA